MNFVTMSLWTLVHTCRFVKVQLDFFRCLMFALCDLEIKAMFEPIRFKLMVEVVSLVNECLIFIQKFGGYIDSKNLC
jgi:hypothetical protein